MFKWNRSICIVILVTMLTLTHSQERSVADVPAKAKADLEFLDKMLQRYREKFGKYPIDLVDLYKGIGEAEGFGEDALIKLTDSQSKGGTVNYIFKSSRPDQSPLNNVRQRGLVDVMFSTSTYNQLKNGVPGGTVILTSNGTVEMIPLDEVLSVPHIRQEAFPNQTNVPGDLIETFEEGMNIEGIPYPMSFLKPWKDDSKQSVLDNGGPESLIAFSRRLAYPDRYGVEREKLWQVFDPAQPEFTLADISQGAAKLDLPLQQKKLTLDELQKLGTPAIFMTQDSKRLVTLADLDDKEAILLDQGMTRIVSREVLQKRYGGEALLATSAVETPTDAPRVLAADPIRVLEVKDRSADIKQDVKITNSGKTPLTLQIERPIPGGKEADLSSETVAPGQSSTLSLTLKWRDILKGETQNVFVFLRTNDPRRPRLQLGFKLNSPQAAADAKP